MISTNGRLTDLACPWCYGTYVWSSPLGAEIVGQCDVIWSHKGKSVELKVVRPEPHALVMEHVHYCTGLEGERG